MPDAFAQRAAHAGRGRELILRPVAAKHLADLEQRRRRESRDRHSSARRRRGRGSGSAACRTGRPRSDWRAQARAPPPNSSRLRLRDERPRHRLGEAARGERALGLARAHLDRREHRLARRLAAAERRRRHTIDAEDAHDLLDDVGLAGTSGRHDGTAIFILALARRRRSRDARARGARRERHVEAGEALELRQRKIDDAVRGFRDLPATAISDGVPPHSSSTICVASSRPGSMKVGSTPRSKR